MAGGSGSSEDNKTPKPPDASSSDTPPANGPTATMAQEESEVELDDFGLPIRKGSPVLYEETQKEDHVRPVADAQQRDREGEIGAAKESVDRTSSDEDEDFEDAVATPPPPPPQVEPSPVETGSQTALAEEDAPAEADTRSAASSDQGEDLDNEKENSEASAAAVNKEAHGLDSEKGSESVEPTDKPGESTPSPQSAAKDPERDEPPETSLETSTVEAVAAKEEHVVLEDKANEVQTADEPSPESRRESVQQPTIAVSGVSEFSHQQVTMPAKEDEDDDDGGWQTMPAFAPYDMYDDDNRLIAKEYNQEVEEDKTFSYAGMGGAGKGYTRVLVDEDAESATSMDENTNYLFKAAAGTSVAEDDETTRDAVSQMQATKDLLTEGQKIAYVGLARIEVAQMVKDMESLQVNRSTKKAVQLGTEALKMWGQKIMIRIYTHMDISAAEQVMIEQLAEHGVISSDLTPQLMANARVKNPMADRKNSVSSSRPASIVSPRRTTSGFSSPRPGTPKTPRAFDDEMPAEPPPAYDKHEGEELPAVRLPDQLPSSEKLDIDIRWTILCDLFLVLVADSIYDSRSRVLFERVGKALEIDWVDICRFEKRVTEALEMQQQAERENWNEDEHMESRRKLALKKRYMVMGLATVGGGLVIGLSAGLLAPVIGAGLAAGFTTIGVTGTTSFLGGAAASAIITSGAAASGSVIGARAANRRTGAVKTFEYRPLHNNKRVNLIVTISGWMTGKVDDVRLPFSTVDPVMGDMYSVLWEPDMLTSMGDTINILATEVSLTLITFRAGAIADTLLRPSHKVYSRS